MIPAMLYQGSLCKGLFLAWLVTLDWCFFFSFYIWAHIGFVVFPMQWQCLFTRINEGCLVSESGHKYRIA